MQGNNAEERVIIDGSQIPGRRCDRLCARRLPLPAARADHQRLQRRRFGLRADTSGNPVVGDLIQGNSIGDYFIYPVDPERELLAVPG